MNSTTQPQDTREKAHSPLPWRVGVGGRIEDTRHVLADVTGYKGREGIANAAFIVRAANNFDALLEALEELTYVRNARTLRQARAAIAKARAS